MPPVTSGLTGWFTGTSFNGTHWRDLGGAGNDGVKSGPVLVRVERNASRPNWLNGQPHLYSAMDSSASSSVTFPTAMTPGTHTIFTVVKYNGATRHRIVRSNLADDWLSGHYDGGNVGVALHGGAWITTLGSPQPQPPQDSWLINTDYPNRWAVVLPAQLERDVGSFVLFDYSCGWLAQVSELQTSPFPYPN